MDDLCWICGAQLQDVALDIGEDETQLVCSPACAMSDGRIDRLVLVVAVPDVAASETNPAQELCQLEPVSRRETNVR